MNVRHLLTTLKVSLAAMVALAAFATSPAHAAEDKIYPGAQCVLNTLSLGQPTVNFFGSIGNPSPTNNLYVHCPLIHDLNTTKINFGVVAVINQVAGSAFVNRVNCTLFSLNIPSDGTWTGSWDTQYSSTTSANTQYLVFGSLPQSDHYFYNCAIPGRYNGKTSYVNAYRINES
jgi:hypothetical protein